MTKRNKKKLFSFLFLFALSLGVGYAILSTDLSIAGDTLFKKSTFDVHFENTNITSGSVTPLSGPTIGSNLISVFYNITLTNPGDFFEFTVDVKNSGTIDAMISSVTNRMNGEVITTLPSYMEYSVTYSDGVAVSNNHLLAAGAKETYRVRVAYKDNIENTDLPGSDTSTNFQFAVSYVQSDENGIEKPPRIVYAGADYSNFAIHNPIPSNSTTFDSFDEAISAMGEDVSFRFILDKNQNISEAYIGFVIDGNTYYIRAFVDEAALTDKPVYNANISAMQTAFGTGYCNAYSSSYVCSKNVVWVRVDNSGYVGAQVGGVSCYISSDSNDMMSCNIIG